MSIKQRLRNAEKKMGIADDEPVQFKTIYENQDGSADEVSRMVVFSGSGRSFLTRREPSEHQDQFEARVQATIQKYRSGKSETPTVSAEVSGA